jgi:ribonuclease P protein component
MKKYSLNIQERLKSQIHIKDLFTTSSSFGKRPLRFLWNVKEVAKDASICKIVVAVPKRNIKNAVDRNRIRRMIKESYRVNKTDILSFFNERNMECHLGILFVGKSMVTFENINEAMCNLLEKLPKEYEKHIK